MRKHALYSPAACLFTLFGALSWAGHARAADAALAESLFREGRALMDKGEYESACPRLSESFAQDAATGTLLALALCQEHVGKTASAWASFSEVVARSRRDGRTDREQAAREHIDLLTPQLSRLTIAVEPAAASTPNLSVTRDGVLLGSGAWGSALPVDPGEHVVQAVAPGKKTVQVKLMIGSKADAQTVHIPALTEAPLPAAPPASAALRIAEPGTGAEQGQRASRSLPLRPIGLAVGGAGVLALGVSGYFALHAKGLDNDSKANEACNAQNQCEPAALSLRHDAVNAANVASVLLVTGAVLTASGVVLWVLGAPEHEEAARLAVTPLVGPGFSVLSVQGQF